MVVVSLTFFQKMILTACLLGSGLNNIFHRVAQLHIIFRSLSSSTVEQFLSLTFESSDLSLAKICKSTLFRQVNHLCKLGIKQDPKQILEGHWLKCFLRKRFVHLTQPFVYSLPSNLSIVSISHLPKAFEISLSILVVGGAVLPPIGKASGIADEGSNQQLVGGTVYNSLCQHTGICNSLAPSCAPIPHRQ